MGGRRERAFGFNTCGFIEEFLGENVLGDKDDGAPEGAEDAEDVAGELDGTGEDDAEREGDEGEVGGCCVTDVKNEAVGQDGEKWGEAFDRVDEGHRDLFRGGGGEDMAADLEHCERKGGTNYVAGGVADAVFENWNSFLEGRKQSAKEGEGDAPGGDAGELDDGEGDWLGEGIEDRLRGCICEC